MMRIVLLAETNESEIFLVVYLHAAQATIVRHFH